MDIFKIAETVPPFLCRLLARKRHGRAPMTTREISKASGIKKSKVALISLKRSWAGVAIDDVQNFSAACGVDITSIRRHREFIRRRKKVFIANAPWSQKRYLEKLMRTG